MKQLLPPSNKTVSEIAKKEGIPKTTIYSWVARARKKGQLIPNSGSDHHKKWRAEDKARIVNETYSMNEQELGAYCRQNGLYLSDVRNWHKIFESSFKIEKPSKELQEELEAHKMEIKKLNKELDYKDKALAETAALLILKKKAESIWGDPEED